MQLLIILYILFITCSSSSSSKTQQTTATSLCNFKVLHNNNNHSDLNFTLISEPTIIRKYYSSAKYTPSKLSSSRLGQSLVGLAHPYYYIIGEGKAEDKMMLKSFLNLFNQAKNEPQHLHRNSSIVFSPISKKNYKICKRIFNSNKRNKQLKTKLKSKKSLCMLSIGGKNNGLALHRHGDAWLQLLHGRKKWIVFPPNFNTLSLTKKFATAASSSAIIEAQKDLVLTILNNNNSLLLEKKIPSNELKEMKVCTQEPGDLVYIPANWKHGTNNNDEITIGIGIQMIDKKHDDDSLSLETDLENILDKATTLMYECKTESELKKIYKRIENLLLNARELEKYDTRSTFLLIELYAKLQYNKLASKEMAYAKELVKMMEKKLNIPTNLLSGLLYLTGYTAHLLREIDDAILIFQRLFTLSPKDTLMYVKSGIMLLKLYFISYDTINTPLGDMDDGDNNMRKKLFLKTSNLLNRLQNEQKNDQSILFPYMTNEEKDILKYVSIELKRYRDDDL